MMRFEPRIPTELISFEIKYNFLLFVIKIVCHVRRLFIQIIKIGYVNFNSTWTDDSHQHIHGCRTSKKADERSFRGKYRCGSSITLDSPFGTHIYSPLRFRYIPYFSFRYCVFTVLLHLMFFTLKFRSEEHTLNSSHRR